MECRQHQQQQFSIGHYLETLNAYHDAGYSIGPVSDYFQNKTFDKHILLRHDVDLSLDYALDMALLEKDNGFHATYFILLHSNLYSALSPEGRERILAIRKAGHEIGLHIDSRYFIGSIEFEILSRLAQCEVTAWCHHLITVTPSLDMPRDASKIPYKYLSDSSMNWREGCWCNHINKYDTLQVLIHPEWHIVSPSGSLNKWDIMEKLEEEAKDHMIKSFRGFTNIMREYEQTINLYT